MTDIFFQHLRGITWCQIILKIYQRPPKAAQRSIKAVSKTCTIIDRKNNSLCLLGINRSQVSTKTHQRSKKKIKGHQRPNRVGKGCDKWMLLNSKKHQIGCF